MSRSIPSRLAFALLFAALTSCSSEGRLALRFSYDGDLTGLFVHARIRTEAGGVLSGSIAPATDTARLSLSVPHGAGRVAVVELRDGASPTGSNVIAYGVSAPFSLQPGDDTVVEAEVVLRPVPAILELEAPAVTRDGAIEVRVAADREGVAQVVIAQDPSLTFGRQLFDASPGTAQVLTYDIDAACRATTTCRDGRRNVFARLVDAEGYSSTATSTPVVVDTRPPAVLPGSGAVRFIAPGELLTPNAAGTGVTVRLSFVFDEPVTSTPAVVLADSGLAFDLVSTELGAYIYERVVRASDPPGLQRPTVQARDPAGNEAPLLAPDLEYGVDHDPPMPPRVEVADAIVFHRDPYRDASAGGPSFTVVGAPGSVEGGARVVAYDRAQAFAGGVEVANRAGVGDAAPDGSFTLRLAPVDLRAVFLLVLDSAGNFHDATGRATRVRDISLRVPAGRRSGPEPPVQVYEVDRLDDTARLDRAGVVALADASALALDDGLTIESRYDPRWTERLPTPSAVPDAIRFAGVASDPARGRLVVYGGRSAADFVRSDTWEWDGRRWVAFPTSLDRPSCDDGTTDGDDPFNVMTYHGSIGLTLVVCRYLEPRQAPPLPPGGTDTLRAFGWNGAAWRAVELEATPAPGGRSGTALAYDPSRGRTVMFGGNEAALIFPGAAATTLGDTWELETVPTSSVGRAPRLRWIERTPSGPTPPPRDRHAMVYAPSLGGVVLFGGISAAGDRHALDDLWVWDGATWTEIPKSGAWPPARALHTLVYDPRTGAVGVVGGLADEPVSTSIDLLDPGLVDAWWWDGASWTETPAAPEAPRGPGLAAASLREREEVYAVSGVAPGAAPSSSRTFVVDAARWSDRTPSAAIPTQTETTQLLYDPGRDLVWMHTAQGVITPYDFLSETWLWTDSGWRFVDFEPSMGQPVSGVFDTRRGEALVLARGPDAVYPFYTFVHDGDAWTRTSTTAPVQPQGFIRDYGIPFDQFFYDRARDRPVAFSHDDYVDAGNGSYLTQELYVWTHPTWERIDRRPSISNGLESPIVVYEDRTGHYLLQSTSAARSRTYTFDGTDWVERTGSEGEWGVGRGVVSDVARQRVLTIGARSGRARAWTWDGAVYRARPTAGPAPSRYVHRGLTYDPRRRRVVVTEAPNEFSPLEAPAGAVYLLDVDPAAAPAVTVRARLGEGGVAPGLVQRVHVEARAGGVGYAATSSVGVWGATLVAFDRSAARWIDLATNTADADRPDRLAYDLTAQEISSLLAAADAQLLLAIESTEGLGAGDASARVEVDAFDVVVDYRLP